MEIGGCDITVKTEMAVPVPLIEILIEKHWPNLVREIQVEPTQTHLFAYKNQAAMDAWNTDVADANFEVATEWDRSMIYVIFEEDKRILTFVIDNDKHNQYIVDDIVKYLKDCEKERKI